LEHSAVNVSRKTLGNLTGFSKRLFTILEQTRVGEFAGHISKSVLPSATIRSAARTAQKGHSARLMIEQRVRAYALISARSNACHEAANVDL
jgi:hypothetical protein